MKYCSNCSEKVHINDHFCGHCGTEIKKETQTCNTCGNAIAQNEKFCSKCGSQVFFDTPKPKASKKKNVTLKKLSTKSNHSKKTKLLIALVFLIGLVYFVINNDNEEKFMKTNTKHPYDTEGIDGIGDIDDEQNDALRGRENNAPIQYQAPTETKQMIEASNKVENAFKNGDVNALKALLSKQSRNNFENISNDIKPQMKDYANAFSNRKLVLNTNIYALYEFKDKNGKRYTAEFSLNENGEWKLVRF